MTNKSSQKMTTPQKDKVEDLIILLERVFAVATLIAKSSACKPTSEEKHSIDKFGYRD